jgi:hypothetical protein
MAVCGQVDLINVFVLTKNLCENGLITSMTTTNNVQRYLFSPPIYWGVLLCPDLSGVILLTFYSGVMFVPIYWWIYPPFVWQVWRIYPAIIHITVAKQSLSAPGGFILPLLQNRWLSIVIIF